ncbi:MAG: hypothetical protein AAF335_01955, partial [Bacteroidota bacterium]
RKGRVGLDASIDWYGIYFYRNLAKSPFSPFVMIKILLSTLLIFSGLCEKNTTTIPPTTTSENVTQTTLDNHPPYVNAGQEPIIVEAHVGEPEKYRISLDKIKDPDHDDLIYQITYNNTKNLPAGVSFITPMLVVEGVKKAAYNLTLVGTDPHGAFAKLPILLSIVPSEEKIIEEDTLSIVAFVGIGSFFGISLPATVFCCRKGNNVMKYLSVVEAWIGAAQILTAALSISEGERIYSKLIIGAGALNISVGGVLLVKGIFDFIAAYRKEDNYISKHQMSIRIKICLALSELATGGILIYADFTQVDILMSRLLPFLAAFNTTSSFLINLIDSWQQNRLFKAMQEQIKNSQTSRQEETKSSVECSIVFTEEEGVVTKLKSHSYPEEGEKNNITLVERLKAEKKEEKKRKRKLEIENNILRKMEIERQLDFLKNAILSMIQDIQKRNYYKSIARQEKAVRERMRKNRAKAQKEKINKIIQQELEPTSEASKKFVIAGVLGLAVATVCTGGVTTVVAGVGGVALGAGISKGHDAHKSKKKVAKAKKELHKIKRSNEHARRYSVSISQDEYVPDAYFLLRQKMKTYGVTISLERYSKKSEIKYSYNLDDIEKHLPVIQQEILRLSAKPEVLVNQFLQCRYKD